jgi:hypothetical protein
LAAIGLILGFALWKTSEFNRFLEQAQFRSKSQSSLSVAWTSPVNVCFLNIGSIGLEFLPPMISAFELLGLHIDFNQKQHVSDCLKESHILVLRSSTLDESEYQRFRQKLISLGAYNLTSSLPGEIGFTTFFGMEKNRTVALVWHIENSKKSEISSSFEKALFVQELFHALTFGNDISKDSTAQSILHEPMSHHRLRSDYWNFLMSWTPYGLCKYDLMFLKRLYWNSEPSFTNIIIRDGDKVNVFEFVYLWIHTELLMRHKDFSVFVDQRC